MKLSQFAKYGLPLVASMAVVSQAMATAIVDYSAAVTAATTEITAGAGTGVTLFGTVLAISIGIRVMKKFAHA